MTEINIPEGVTEIGYGAFKDCSGLTEINIPKGVTRIENDTFKGCSGLTEINIPEGVTEIGFNAFEGCSGLTEINIPDGVTTIRSGAFLGCSGLTEINIPDGVTTIKSRAFEGCSGLTEINIPEGVTEIGYGAFKDCSGLTELKVQPSKENMLYYLYREYKDKVETSMFGDDLSRFHGIKSQARFSNSYDYDEGFMDELYHKIIFSVGIDELEKMIKIPQALNAEQLSRYDEAFRESEEIYSQLYENKQNVIGDLGVAIKTFKQVAINLNKMNKNKGDSSQLDDILNQVKSIMNAQSEEFDSLEELMEKATTMAGFDWSTIKESVRNIQKSINKSQFQTNMDNVRGILIDTLSSNDTAFGPQIAALQVDAIEKIIEDKLKKIYMANSRVSVEDLNSILLHELSNENHAIYIRQNAQNIVDRFMNLLNTNKEFSSKINHNSVDAFRFIQSQIGDDWIKLIMNSFMEVSKARNIQSIPDAFSEEQINDLQKKLGVNIETSQVAVLKKGADREEAYKLFERIQNEHPEDEQLIVTYKQLHDMFGGVHYPYSEEFKKYFKQHSTEFMKNPRYFTMFASICNKFDYIINSPELKNRYRNGKLELDDIIGYMGEVTYMNMRPGDEAIAKLSSSIGEIVTDDQFAEVQKVFDIVKNRERASIPPVYVQDKKSKFRGRMLSPNDILTMFAGNITTCCQRFGDVGMGAMLLGAIEENAGIFVVEELQDDGSYQIIGQSLTIRQRGKDGNYDRLAFDNVEITKNVKTRLTSSDNEEILAIYQNAGLQAMEYDKKFLYELLREGMITQEDYDNLVIKEVIAGRGFNDLEILDTLQSAETIVPNEAYYQYRTVEWGTVKPWIDSTEYGAPKGSNSFKPVIIASMDESEKEIINSRRAKSGKKISDITNIPLWYGKIDEPEILHEDQIEIIKKIERKVYRPAQQVMNNENLSSYEDICGYYELEYLNSVIGSEKNWYMICGTNYKGEFSIQDLALEGGVNSNKNSNSAEQQSSSKLAAVEMADVVYGLLIEKARDGVKIVCNATKDTSLINIKNMIRKGIADIYDTNGRKIVISDNGELVYENGEDVTYRDFEDDYDEYEGENDRDESIKMLDLEIRPNIEKMIEEKIKTEKYLQLARRAKRLKGVAKEDGLDERRRTIMNDLSK